MVVVLCIDRVVVKNVPLSWLKKKKKILISKLYRGFEWSVQLRVNT